MAENKKSFILYTDTLKLLEHLNDDQAGKLFKHIFQYVNDKDPQTDDVLLKIAFEPIKQQLKRDLKKWDKYIEKQRINGKKGGRPTEATQTQITQALFEKPKKADNVNVNVNVNDNVNEREYPPTGFWTDEADKLQTIKHCKEIALKDDRWVKANKTNEAELLKFNTHLEKLGENEKTFKDYKKHFANLKTKNPDSVKPSSSSTLLNTINHIKNAK